MPRNKGNAIKTSTVTPYLIQTDTHENLQTDFFGKKNSACIFHISSCKIFGSWKMLTPMTLSRFASGFFSLLYGSWLILCFQTGQLEAKGYHVLVELELMLTFTLNSNYEIKLLASWFKWARKQAEVHDRRGGGDEKLTENHYFLQDR